MCCVLFMFFHVRVVLMNVLSLAAFPIVALPMVSAFAVLLLTMVSNAQANDQALPKNIAPTVITTLPPPFKGELTHRYFLNVLKLALDKTTADYGPYEITLTGPMQSAPALLELSRPQGGLDVVWTGSSDQREKILKPIKIPLLRGVLGYRVPLLHQRIQSRYETIKNVEQLSNLKICQGQFWPDSDILEYSGLTVKRYRVFQSMIEAVYSGECDIFLRGIHEGPVEWQQWQEQYPELKMSTSPLVYYPLPMYFFVGKHDTELYQRLEQGMQVIVADGSLDQLMRQDPVTQHLFPLAQWLEGHAIHISNPNLTQLPESYHSDFWLKPRPQP